MTGAVAFLWLGMVLAISFLEAPLKFRAPGVTVPIGLGVGRLVFAGLNAAEVVLAAMVVVALVLGGPPAGVVVAAVVVGAVLVVQLGGVRPVLRRRSAAVLAGRDPGTRSRAHLVYVALEVVKVVGLVVLGVSALSS